MYPITLKLEGRPCVVLGGGKMAFAKVGPLLQAKADVTVVSPEMCSELERLALEGRLKAVRKKADYADFEHAFLVIAATDDPEWNRRVYEYVKDTKLVNVISDGHSGNFHIPAVLTRGRLQISVSTGGASPMLAQQIRDELEERFDESWEAYLDFLSEARQRIKSSVRDREERRRLYLEALDGKYRHGVAERERFLDDLSL